jgi:hypothetical protein
MIKQQAALQAKEAKAVAAALKAASNKACNDAKEKLATAQVDFNAQTLKLLQRIKDWKNRHSVLESQNAKLRRESSSLQQQLASEQKASECLRSALHTKGKEHAQNRTHAEQRIAEMETKVEQSGRQLLNCWAQAHFSGQDAYQRDARVQLQSGPPLPSRRRARLETGAQHNNDNNNDNDNDNDNHHNHNWMSPVASRGGKYEHGGSDNATGANGQHGHRGHTVDQQARISSTLMAAEVSSMKNEVARSSHRHSCGVIGVVGGRCREGQLGQLGQHRMDRATVQQGDGPGLRMAGNELMGAGVGAGVSMDIGAVSMDIGVGHTAPRPPVNTSASGTTGFSPSTTGFSPTDLSEFNMSCTNGVRSMEEMLAAISAIKGSL